MGNCLRHKSSKIVACAHVEELNCKEFRSSVAEEKSVLEDISKVPCSSTEVKIKITKKQLQELLGKVQVKDVSLGDVLTQLLNISDEHCTEQQRWRPVLQSIPEAN
ncbi:hypothetical protein ACHQM5_003560 [Ranunculus cassubicifolius]